VFSAEDAVEWAQRGRNVILVRQLTEADDVRGFHAAQGILTAEGGKASHAALVARGTGKPYVAGAAALEVNVDELELRCGDLVLREGDLIAIDGSTGRVTTDDVPLSAPALDEYFDTVLGWADELRRLGVRANADTPEDAGRAREFGAEGIGLCRTEHMFMAADRQPKMQAMILAASTEDRRAALQELLPLQREDFEALFELCFTMLHHIPSLENQDRAFAEIARVLRPGGTFTGTDSLSSGVVFKLIHVGDTLNLIDPDTLPGRLQNAGMDRPEVKVGGRSFRWRATKP
jgi:phosphohistidine swiveling domain-containing protein